MANRIKYSVSVTPLETLTDENSGTHDIIASEVNKTLGGGGDSVNLTSYAQTAANQGYLNATVNYKEASHSAGGTLVSGIDPDFLFIKNTGYKFSSATALGVSTTDCVMVAIRTLGWEEAVQNGWALGDGTPTSQIHFFQIAWLKPGQAIALPQGSSITQFGSNANDVSPIGSSSQNGISDIYVRTFQSDGSAATSGNAIEYLFTT